MCHPRDLDVSWPSFSGPRQASADGLGHGEPQQHLESVGNGLSVMFGNSVVLVLSTYFSESVNGRGGISSLIWMELQGKTFVGNVDIREFGISLNA